MLHSELSTDLEGHPVPTGYVVRQRPNYSERSHALRTYAVYRVDDDGQRPVPVREGTVYVYGPDNVSGWSRRNNRRFEGRTVPWVLDRITAPVDTCAQREQHVREPSRMTSEINGWPIPTGYAVRRRYMRVRRTPVVYDVYDVRTGTRETRLGVITIFQSGDTPVRSWRKRDGMVSNSASVEAAFKWIADQPVLVDAPYDEIEVRVANWLASRPAGDPEIFSPLKNWTKRVPLPPGEYTTEVVDATASRTHVSLNYLVQASNPGTTMEDAMARIYGGTATGRINDNPLSTDSLRAERDRALARVERIEQRLARVEEFGEDDYTTGEVLRFDWTPASPGDKTYHIAVIKVGVLDDTDPTSEYWVMTGPVLSQRRYTWADLVQFLVDADVSEVYWASEYTPVV